MDDEDNRVCPYCGKHVPEGWMTVTEVTHSTDTIPGHAIRTTRHVNHRHVPEKCADRSATTNNPGETTPPQQHP